MVKRKKLKSILLSIAIVCATLVLIMFVHQQFFLSYKCKGHCSDVESDANKIAAAISDYFAIPGRTDIKPGDLDEWLITVNPWTFIQCRETIYIYVYDLKEDCPADYQEASSGWNSSIYTKIFD